MKENTRYAIVRDVVSPEGEILLKDNVIDGFGSDLNVVLEQVRIWSGERYPEYTNFRIRVITTSELDLGVDEWDMLGITRQQEGEATT